MSDTTYYNWKSKYYWMTVSDLKKMKALKEENQRLKQIVAYQAPESFKRLTAKKLLKPRAKGLAVNYTRERIVLSERS